MVKAFCAVMVAVTTVCGVFVCPEAHACSCIDPHPIPNTPGSPTSEPSLDADAPTLEAPVYAASLSLFEPTGTPIGCCNCGGTSFLHVGVEGIDTSAFAFQIQVVSGTPPCELGTYVKANASHELQCEWSDAGGSEVSVTYRIRAVDETTGAYSPWTEVSVNSPNGCQASHGLPAPLAVTLLALLWLRGQRRRTSEIG